MRDKINTTDEIDNISTEIDIDGAQNINKIHDILFSTEMRKNNS